MSQHRENPRAHTIASDRHIGIGDIFAPSLLQSAQVSADLFVANSQKRTYNAAVPKPLFRKNAGQASRTRPTCNFHQHSLSLVIERVRSSDTLDFIGQDRLEKFVPQLPRCCFKTHLYLT